ncbi:MAG: glycoside hydrolase family 44 protein [Solidesulfovibrio sp. DCME]|uniref:glycoside hydrolase family 44 protein n=1 Tax=Solidesulfovibrio sp. DCME TaxID=3447380 RepID=UPI003D0A09D2
MPATRFLGRPRFLLALTIALPLVCASLAPARAADTILYAETLAQGWANWSWGATVDLAASAPAHAGVAAIAATLNTAWAGLYLHADAPLAASGFANLRFFIHGGPSGGQNLKVVLGGDTANAVAVTPVANAWTEVVIPLSSLGSPAQIGDIVWQDASGTAQPVFYLDDISLTAATGPAPDPTPAPALTVDAATALGPISPDIYGMNFADEALAAALRLPVRRNGGNATSRYNWRVDAYNTGSDWYFENIASDNADPSRLPDGSAADRFVDQDRRTGTRSLLTIPMLGYVAKRRLESHPYDCGFKVSVYGAQQATDPWDPDCGNGVAAGGGNITSNAPTDTSLAFTPADAADWIAHLQATFGSAASGGVAYLDFDNEPMLWNSTHRDVHPSATSYDELASRTMAYGAAVKAADPGIATLGPATWGWCAWFHSAVDGCSPGTDQAAHDDLDFTAWYLQRLRRYETENGHRILDYLDLHYYPQASGVALSTAGSTAVQALRLRATRSLWDPAYTDESWINQPVKLLPRMRQWVADNYPGTKLAVTEYNFGGLEHINGALAQADILGIFGREGLDLATLWSPPSIEQPGAFAFRLYRNYDGAGHGFGETALAAASADQGVVSVYAARRAADRALTVMVINKATTAQTATLALRGFTPAGPAAAYRYDATDLTAIRRLDDQAVTAAGWTSLLPASSITLFVVPAAGGGIATWLPLLLQ